MLCMMRLLYTTLSFAILGLSSLWAVPPVLNYAGQVSVNGQAFNGEGLLKFALVNPDGNVTHWSHDGTSVDGSEPSGQVSVQVRGGLYSILLGNTSIPGMDAMNPSLFQQISDLHLRVWFSDGVNGFERISPDRPFASVPYAMSAGTSEIGLGSISLDMLSSEVRADLNRTFTEEDLSVDVLRKIQLSPSISTQPFARYKWGTDSVIIEVKGNGYQLSYQWFKNNVLIEGEASSVIEITNPDFDANHSYKVKLLNTYGEVNSSAVSLKDAIGVPDPSSNEYNYLITDDLLIHLPFDETSGNIAHDVSGNFHHLEITGFDGATAAWSQGKIGGAFSFDGVDDWGSVPVVLEQNFTMSVWLKTIYAEGYSTQWNYDSFYERYVGAISGASQTYGFILNYGKIGFWIGSSGNTWSDPRLYSSIDANSGTWHHFVARREGNETDGNYSLFVNGNLDKSVSFTKQITYGSNTYIGRTFNSSLYYDGEMDDLRIYRRALPEAEIQGLYSLGSDPNAIHSYPGAGPGISFVPKEDSITTEHLSEQILKYLRPEVVRSPALPQDRERVYTGQSVTLSADAEGKYLTYQWLRDGQDIPGATNKEFTITDANASLHNGNYSVRISNDFGHVSTTSVQLDVNDTQLIHEVDLNASVALEMIWVEPGTFTMGQDGVATPVHEVTLTQGFYLGKYEVTQAQYEAVMTGNTDFLSATPSNWPNNPDRPVEQVSYDDIQVFLTRLNEQQSGSIPAGWAYVLPTEAQWEYACRAGTTTAYSWGESITSDDANYNWDGDWNTGADFKETRDVGQYSANPWGFFDMHGNVWEWTADWYAAYSSGAQTDPEGTASGSTRVIRGGSWNLTGAYLRSASRYDYNPSTRGSGISFRVGFQQVPADVASPEMSILGDANITQLQGVAWVDPGVEAHDVRDGNLSGDVTVSGTVDVNTVGAYTLTYTVSDAVGNQASLTRTVNIVAGQASTHTADLNASVAMEMIWVEPGSFTMGQDGVATPVHEVTLTKGFYLGKYEVTQAQYEAVMTGNTDSLSATPSNWPNNPDRPVEQVSYDDIQVFLTRLNEQQSGSIPAGWAYVLPTEAQWEYACRAGMTTAYSWGATIASSNANYNWDGGANDGNDFKQTRDVGQYAANPWGFFDMHGNVREWTADAYASYATGAQTDPFNVGTTGSSRVDRGGSWYSPGTALRSAFRYGITPSFRYSSRGFRVGFQQQSADVASPEISILGDANITQLQGVAWVDPGVEANDERDGNLTSSVSVSGTVDVNTTGTYTLTYTVSDAAGNEASLTRTVNIVAGQASTHTADLNASVALEMIWVEPGTFTMGSPTTEAGRSTNETQHEVTLTQGFYLGKYEVTQAQYQAVMTGNTDGLNATPSNWPNNADRPVEKVSHDDIQKFLTRLNAQQAGNIPEGWAYVLPTEAQWEYACRAGTTTAYSWGDSITTDNANYSDSGYSQTRDVGQYSANPWGFFDMHGNVYEWTADAYASYATGAQTDPFNVGTSGSTRVIRGGSWANTGTSLRSAHRYDHTPSYRHIHIGFRLSLQKVPYVADLNSTVALEMIWVEPGTFTMGQDGVATPVHEVTLTKGFYLGKYEVTQAQYEAVMTGNTDSLSATPSQWPNNPDRPVEKVSWDDIQKFLTRLNSLQAGNIPEGWAYVLPTEAQWEYACRAGTTTAYSWGDSITTDNANYSSSGYSQTRDVGIYDANPWGFFDMHGNVYEWTADAYASYATGAQTDPFNVGTAGSYRLRRGGSWASTGTDLRSAFRNGHDPSLRNVNVGFRVGFQQQ